MLLIIAMSLFYIAGMYYNDACDASHDAQHQKHRPIPAGLISRNRVQAYALSFTLLALLLVCVARVSAPMAQGSTSVGWLVSVLLLISCIIIYNHYHKDNPLSPLWMAACRITVLLTTSYALTASLPPEMFLLILATLAWLAGLTSLAKQEQSVVPSTSSLTHTWPLYMLSLPVLIGAYLSLSSPVILIPTVLIALVISTARSWLRDQRTHLRGGAIALLIAGICLVDGLFLAWAWGGAGAAIAVVACAITLAFQRWIAGT